MTPSTGTIRAFLQLRGTQRLLVSEAAVCLVATRAGLRLFGFSRWNNILAKFSQSPSRSIDITPQQLLADATNIAALSASTARHLWFRTNCLDQSLVLWFLLARRGIPANLRFGARKERDRFEAHAWVELFGAILNDDGSVHQHFTPFEGSAALMEKRID